MIKVVRNKRMLAMLLGVVLILGTFASFGAAAQGRNDQRSYHSRTREAVIGAAAGARTGYMGRKHRNRRHRHYVRRDRRDRSRR